MAAGVIRAGVLGKIKELFDHTDAIGDAPYTIAALEVIYIAADRQQVRRLLNASGAPTNTW
jgi:hypothetical protein